MTDSISYLQGETHARHVVVVGGGITGLSAAWYLRQAGFTVTVLESSSRWGGKIHTEVVDIDEGRTFVVEAGPDSFIAQKPWATQLARDLGLADDLLGTNDHQRRIFVLRHGKLTPLPDGLLLIVPTRFMPFALSPLISLPGKFRMALESFIPVRQGDEDETLGDFVRRRLGREALDRLAEPLMSGIYNTDPDEQSLLATFPRFRTLELEYGSLTRGMLASRRVGRPPSSVNGEPASMFISFRQGMQVLVDALVAQLDGSLRLEAPVKRIERHGQSYRVHLDDSEILDTDGVLMTTPAPTTATLLHAIAPEAAQHLRAMTYVSTGTVSLAYRAESVQHLPDSFGVVIPRSEGRSINAVTNSSAKFDHRAPPGYSLLRVFFGGRRSPQTLSLPDDDIVRVVQEELKAIYGINDAPVFTRIYRWQQATPQYAPGHLNKVAEIEASLPEGLYVAGGAFRGIGVPDCVHQAQQVVERLLKPEERGEALV
ncbi:protoporphyrinogen oxidase [bacterium]|nr:protoporphyrinogen oxidase [bacterium]